MESTYGHSVSLKQYRKVDGKWQFVPVVRNNRIPDPSLILIGDKPVSSKGGTFYLDWRENGKRKSRKVGTTPREALDAWRQQSGVMAGEITEEEAPGRASGDQPLTIDEGIKKFLTDVKATKSMATYRQYRKEMTWFRGYCQKRYVRELSRDDAMLLFANGREERIDGRALNQKTINRKVMIMIMAMRSQGAAIELKKGEWPSTVDKKIEQYEPEEINAFFAACNPEERLLFQVFLCTGFRDKEVAYLGWTDIDWREGKLAVSAKPTLGFTPKTYEERSAPVPRALIESLAKRKKTSKSLLVFPTAPHPTKKECKGDKPSNHFLDRCKEVGFRTGLNCGHCTGSYTVYVMRQGISHKEQRRYQCSTAPRCEKWQLHRWRHTYATSLLQDDVDRCSYKVIPRQPPTPQLLPAIF